MFPHWLCRSRFRTPKKGGETYVVAPHQAPANQGIISLNAVLAYESGDFRERVTRAMATQRFNGYYQFVRGMFSTEFEITSYFQE